MAVPHIADQMNLASLLTPTAASSITAPAAAPRDDARAHAERQRQRRAVGVARRKTEQHRPGKFREQVRDDGPARRTAPPARRSAASRRTRSPTRAASSPPGAAASACGRCGTAARRLRRGTGRCPAGGSNAYGVPSDASELRQRAADEHAASLAGAQRSRACGCAISPSRFGPAQTRCERVAIVAGRALRQPALEHRPVERDDAAARRQPREQGRVVAVADEGLRVPADVAGSSSGSICTLP